MVEAGYHTARGRYTFRGAYGNTSLRFESPQGAAGKSLRWRRTILESGGYKRPPTSSVIVCRAKKTQSGDLSELLATAYVNSETAFVIPTNKLR